MKRIDISAVAQPIVKSQRLLISVRVVVGESVAGLDRLGGDEHETGLFVDDDDLRLQVGRQRAVIDQPPQIRRLGGRIDAKTEARCSEWRQETYQRGLSRWW